MSWQTTDLCDQYSDRLQIAEPIFRDFGGSQSFCGPIETIKAYEDNSLVRRALEEPGAGRVLVVDAGGSLRCAMLGDLLAAMGEKNGWAGVVMYGCVRDSAALARIGLGVKAIAAMPIKSEKKGAGERGIPVRFAGVRFESGAWLYADEDGIIVSADKLPV